MDLNKLHALAELADQLENQGFIIEACDDIARGE